MDNRLFQIIPETFWYAECFHVLGGSVVTVVVATSFLPLYVGKWNQEQEPKNGGDLVYGRFCIHLPKYPTEVIACFVGNMSSGSQPK